MKIVQLFLMALVLAVIATGNSVAGKPTIIEGIFNGNGFPSGPHYNLILHGKKDSYNCSSEKWVCSADSLEFVDQSSCESSCVAPDDCEQVFGNVINMPYGNATGDNAPGQILIESGRKGPKGATIETLRVTDACAGFDTNDAASFQLPANKEGYALYLKIVGKPGDGISASFAYPDFEYVEDELGKDLILLGGVFGEDLVQVDGESIVVYRSDSNTKGNKVPKATDLTPLFTYTGTTCYFDSINDAGFDYCFDPDAVDNNACTPYYICCLQDIESDGIYDSCEAPVGSVCEDGFDLITVSCRDYSEDPQWIFNIADFVGMLWEVTNNGAYNIQLRFYPLPLN